MEKQRARRKTALIRAPTTCTQSVLHSAVILCSLTSARAHPKVLKLQALLLSLKTTSFNLEQVFWQPCPGLGGADCTGVALPETDQGDDEGDDVTQHVETVGHERSAVGEVTHRELHPHQGGGEAQHRQ